ncbi:hypothetical protein C8R43DRAFT_948890 [Mycena crocata]|nr:hypothetical protein C8R43DRAFT_948890 [Mycena crocata]
MADPARRYPLRSRRAPHHADSPVSYALGRPIAEEEMSSSDDESPGYDSDIELLGAPPAAVINPFTPPNNLIPIVVVDNDEETTPSPGPGNVYDTNASPLGHPALTNWTLTASYIALSHELDLQFLDLTEMTFTERDFMHAVDGFTPGDKATLLIEKIHRLRGTTPTAYPPPAAPGPFDAVVTNTVSVPPTPLEFNPASDMILSSPLPTNVPAMVVSATTTVNLAATSTAIGQDPKSVYLLGRFPDEFTAIRSIQQTYQTAYQHCRIERICISICNALGIVIGSRRIIPALLPGGLEFSPDDVAGTANIPSSTFSTFRTELHKVRKLRGDLGRYTRRIDAGGVAHQAHSELLELMSLIDAMLVETLIDPGFLADATGSVQAEAVTIGIGEFMKRVKRAIAQLNPPA